MLTWNCKNFVMPTYTLRPHFTASTTLLKLLSSSRMSEASLAMEVPDIMAKPTSALRRAGASLVPSPVMATISAGSAFSAAAKYKTTSVVSVQVVLCTYIQAIQRAILNTRQCHHDLKL